MARTQLPRVVVRSVRRRFGRDSRAGWAHVIEQATISRAGWYGTCPIVASGRQALVSRVVGPRARCHLWHAPLPLSAVPDNVCLVKVMCLHNCAYRLATRASLLCASGYRAALSLRCRRGRDEVVTRLGASREGKGAGATVSSRQGWRQRRVQSYARRRVRPLVMLRVITSVG